MSTTLRHLIALPKRFSAPPGSWRMLPTPPRLSPFTRSLRSSPDWRWRAAEAVAAGAAGGETRFLLLATVNPRLGQYRAWLLDRVQDEWRLLARLEDHAGHPGLHIHAWCPDLPPAQGPSSIDAPLRLPRRRSRRTAQCAALDVFWARACATFRIAMPATPTQGTLL